MELKKIMKKSELRGKSLGFKEDKIHYEFFKNSEDKRPMGTARVEFKAGNKRIGKLYWDEIRLIYGDESTKKPFLDIKTLNGFKIRIWRNKIRIYPYEQMNDTCYLGGLIEFDAIEFYGEFIWTIHIEELNTFR